MCDLLLIFVPLKSMFCWLKKCCSIKLRSNVILPVVGTVPSLISLHKRDSRLVLPAPLSPMHTTSYSGLGGGGVLQHNFWRH